MKRIFVRGNNNEIGERNEFSFWKITTKLAKETNLFDFISPPKVGGVRGGLNSV